MNSYTNALINGRLFMDVQSDLGTKRYAVEFSNGQIEFNQTKPMSKSQTDGNFKIRRPCPRCGLADSLNDKTDRDDTYTECLACGLTMSKSIWDLPRPLEMHQDKKAMDAYERYYDLLQSYNNLLFESRKK